ncbi:sigma-70 family RNA polymerase sigma factor [Mesorhizobium onobrychidis]|uniref:Sigma-70 family RNA polymerase sigma factor n=1 Tax=Mesorhizobium onobrychidis TaxID=2775404 RepID=A0ABY5QU74_9HYPH|nr:sigma-70 family RNA polymerase sigma factor [Mesorhizobium onobrychidis]UVC14730.1 sigma-70 family RNA polymerase sigma factor [Mesorhizobium onobrychidis]
MAQARSKPFLTREQEQALAIRWRDHRDEAALHQIVEAHRPLVLSIAKKFARSPVPSEDLIQEGNIGLMIAAKKFQPERGLRFSTYAQWWVRHEITDAVLRGTTAVKPPLTNKTRAMFFQGHRIVHEHSIDATNRMNDGEGQAYANILPDTAPLPDAVTEAAIDGERLSAKLAGAVGKLKGREKVIIEARWLSEEGSTLETLAGLLGISKERVRQIENVAFGRLRSVMTGTAAPSRRRSVGAAG